MENNIDELVRKVMYILDRDRHKYHEFADVKTLYNVVMSHTACMMYQDGSVSITPCEGEFPFMDDIVAYVKDNITDQNNINGQEVIDAISSFLAYKIETDIDYLLTHKLHNYYGDHDYITSRVKTIMDAINIIYNDDKTTLEDQELIKLYVPEIKDIRDKIESYNGTRESYLVDVDRPYRRLLKIEKELSSITARRWKEFGNETGAKLVHFMLNNPAIGQSYVKSDDMPKMCTSLYTDKLKNNIASYAHAGYFYDLDFENIFAISYADLGSWTMSKEEFIGIVNNGENKQYMPLVFDRQYSEETNCWLESPNNTLLYLPEYVEQKALELNSTYTEIYINNSLEHKIKPVSCFYTEDATEEEIAMITKLAQEQNIPVQAITINDKEKEI